MPCTSTCPRMLKSLSNRWAIVQLGLVGPLFQITRTIGNEVRASSLIVDIVLIRFTTGATPSQHPLARTFLATCSCSASPRANRLGSV